MTPSGGCHTLTTNTERGQHGGSKQRSGASASSQSSEDGLIPSVRTSNVPFYVFGDLPFLEIIANRS